LLWLFWDGTSWTICPGWPGASVLLIAASEIDRIAAWVIGTWQEFFWNYY
jgi:hypothetical protein